MNWITFNMGLVVNNQPAGFGEFVMVRSSRFPVTRDGHGIEIMSSQNLSSRSGQGVLVVRTSRVSTHVPALISGL